VNTKSDEQGRLVESYGSCGVGADDAASYVYLTSLLVLHLLLLAIGSMLLYLAPRVPSPYSEGKCVGIALVSSMQALLVAVILLASGVLHSNPNLFYVIKLVTLLSTDAGNVLFLFAPKLVMAHELSKVSPGSSRSERNQRWSSTEKFSVCTIDPALARLSNGHSSGDRISIGGKDRASAGGRARCSATGNDRSSTTGVDRFSAGDKVMPLPLRRANTAPTKKSKKSLRDRSTSFMTMSLKPKEAHATQSPINNVIDELRGALKDSKGKPLGVDRMDRLAKVLSNLEKHVAKGGDSNTLFGVDVEAELDRANQEAMAAGDNPMVDNATMAYIKEMANPAARTTGGRNPGAAKGRSFSIFGSNRSNRALRVQGLHSSGARLPVTTCTGAVIGAGAGGEAAKNFHCPGADCGSTKSCDDDAQSTASNSASCRSIAESDSSPRGVPPTAENLGAVPTIVPVMESLLESEALGWEFDIVAFDDKTSGNAMHQLFRELLSRHHLYDEIPLDMRKLHNFLAEVQCDYGANLYHCRKHGADVLLGMHLFLNEHFIAPLLSPVQKVAALFAAMMHDYRHPGTNNAHEIKAISSRTLRYSSESVLERHHLDSTFSCLHKPENNFLCLISRAQYDEFRSLVIEMVLATDLKQHFSFIARLNGMVPSAFTTSLSMLAHPQGEGNANGPQREQPAYNRQARRRSSCGLLKSRRVEGDDDSSTPPPSAGEPPASIPLMLVTAIKTVDLGHTFKPWEQHEAWVDRITNEFYALGDRERDEQLSISPLCDRNRDTDVNASQVGFFSFVIVPFYKAVEHVLPSANHIVAKSRDNLAIWKDRKEELFKEKEGNS